MPDSGGQLSERSRSILEMIATGHSYEQILSAFPDVTYLHIFNAAEEALNLSVGESVPRPGNVKSYTLAEKRERYPRAYLAWSEGEDEMLTKLVRSGTTVARIAGELQRNRGAIRSRIVKLGLENAMTPRERDRLQRNMPDLSSGDGDANPFA